MSFPRQPDFGWSYPPGCNSVPADDEPEDDISFQINSEFVPPVVDEEPDRDITED